MSEIVHLSLGSRANYLHAQYYNNQESYFVYSDSEIEASKVSPTPRFSAGKEFTPRAIFWDLNGGFGNLARISDLYEKKDECINSLGAEKIEIGHTSDSSWTDDLRVKIHPKYRNELLNWHVDTTLDGKARGSDDHQFLLFDEGKEEFKTLGDEYVDDVVRPIFESCDNIAGVNVCTDFSAWAGFTDPILQELRDDFIPKTTLMTWALYESKKYPRTRHHSILQSYLSFTQYSDVVIPLSTAEGSAVQRAEQANIVFEPVCLMSSLRKNRLSMTTLAQNLLANSECNIVQVKGTTRAETGDMFIPFKFDKRDFRMDIAMKKDPKVKNSVVIDRTNKLELTLPVDSAKVYECPQAAPDAVGDTRTELSLTNDPLELRKLIAPWQHEMKEQVYDMTEPYIWGYESDSDFD